MDLFLEFQREKCRHVVFRYVCDAHYKDLPIIPTDDTPMEILAGRMQYSCQYGVNYKEKLNKKLNKMKEERHKKVVA